MINVFLLKLNVLYEAQHTTLRWSAGLSTVQYSTLRRIVRTFISIFPSLHMRYFTGRKPQDFCHYPVDFHSKLHRLSTTEKKHNQKCIEKVKKSHLKRRLRNPRWKEIVGYNERNRVSQSGFPPPSLLRGRIKRFLRLIWWKLLPRAIFGRSKNLLGLRDRRKGGI